MFINTQLRFEPNRDGRVLEAGCGGGRLMHAFGSIGFDVYGVDYAEEAVGRLRPLFPPNHVAVADVTATGFANEYFSAYWSVGVIEHFVDGFGPVAAEAARVLKVGAHAFVAFPHMSHTRRAKALLSIYDKQDGLDDTQRRSFNQYALRGSVVRGVFEAHGFRLVWSHPYGAVLGWIEEIPIARPGMTAVYARPGWPAKGMRYALEVSLGSFMGHSLLQVYEKQ